MYRINAQFVYVCKYTHKINVHICVYFFPMARTLCIKEADSFTQAGKSDNQNNL